MANDRGIEKQIRALREARAARGTAKAPKASKIEELKAITGQIKVGDKVTGTIVGTITATTKGTTMKKPKTSKAKKTAAKRKPAAKAKNAKAGTIKSAKPKAESKSDGVRPGTKLETVVALLKRDGGCTTADVLKATGWPTVSMPQQARAAGLTLKKEKIDGVTHYSV